MISLDYLEGVGIITLNSPGRSVNTLDLQAMQQLEAAFDDIQRQTDCFAALIISSKPDNFLAGVDISLFTSLEPQELRRVTEQGQEFFNRIANFPKPVIAAVHGGCAGGGTELALACHFRLASDSPATHFSLPEVQLGLLPGLGGTQRLPQLIGLQAGLEALLSGRRIFARRARALGLVDALHHREGLLEAALEAAVRMKDGKLRHQGRRAGPVTWLLERTPLSSLLLNRALARAEAQGHGNYPAPARIVAAVRSGRRFGLQAGLQAEAEAFSELAAGNEARALMHVFFARSATRREPEHAPAAAVERVAVLGAGLMGAGIAQVSAMAGLEVRLIERELELAAQGRGRIAADLGKRVGRGLSAFERDRLLESIRLSDDMGDAATAELTIEAVPEDLELKQAVLQRIESVVPPGHVFASNTSSIPIRLIAAGSQRPGQVVGMHYFSPVPRMPLLEVVRSEQSSDAAVATALSVGLRQGKSVIVVGDSPGFYVNRVLAPYMNEAVQLLKEGAAVETVDETMRAAGFPVGPLKLLDEVGLDVAGSVQQVLAPVFARRGIELQGTAALPEAGLLGRKGGEGFYRYGRGGPNVNPRVHALLGARAGNGPQPGEIRKRLLALLLNEAAFTLQEGVLQGALDGDAGAVFGFGFPPFLGGPFQLLDSRGIGTVLAELDELKETHGDRFEAAPLLREMASSGASFYGGPTKPEQ